MGDFALGQCRDVDLRPGPSLCAQIVVHGRNSEWYISGLDPIGQPDTNDDHVKSDGDDRRDLLIGDNVLVGCSSLARHDRLTMSRITY